MKADLQAVSLLQLGAAFSSGLEVDDYRRVKVVVEGPPEAITRIGLTEERIRTRVELRLRALNLTPLSEEDPRGEFLYVSVNGVGRAYSIHVEFVRDVTYFVADSGLTYTALRSLAASWTSGGSTGTHGDDPTFVLNSLDQYLDQFLNEYLKANAP